MSIKSWLKGNSLLNSAIWYTVGTFILKGVNFFTIPIFTRLLSTEDYGVVTIYSTWSAIFAIIVGIGINSTVGSARANLEDDEYKEYLSSTLFLGTISFAVVSFIVLIFRNQVSNMIGFGFNLVIILLFESFFTFVINFVTSVFTFDKNHKAYILSSVVVTIINVSISVMLITSMNSDKYFGKICGSAISAIIVGLFLYIKIILRGRKLISLKYWKFCLPIAIPLIFHNLSHLVLNQADKIMLQKMTTEAAVGIYGFTYTIGSLINTIQLAINSAWVPWYYDGLKLDDKEGIKEKSKIYIAVFTTMTVLFILGVPEVVKIFSSQEYWTGIPLLPIIIIGYYFVFLYTFPSNYQFYIRKTKFIAMATILSGLVNIAINALLIPKMGVYGAAIATLIAYIVLFLVHHFIVTFKYKHSDFPFTYYLVGVGIVLLAALIFYVFIDYLVIRWALMFIIGLVWVKIGLGIYKKMNCK
ncbi:MAG: oligosaccharide flippase family protein [Clostridium paraputrificum]|uniref:oligosaccharide flippase family protein n=1 Tax=Clostridium paraputrificum TaxID=29363 RepID=UPI000C07A96F|nr:oligosaccharide flippase family protein [Clostridium paraputrificum]